MRGCPSPGRQYRILELRKKWRPLASQGLGHWSPSSLMRACVGARRRLGAGISLKMGEVILEPEIRDACGFMELATNFMPRVLLSNASPLARRGQIHVSAFRTPFHPDAPSSRNTLRIFGPFHQLALTSTLGYAGLLPGTRSLPWPLRGPGHWRNSPSGRTTTRRTGCCRFTRIRRRTY